MSLCVAGVGVLRIAATAFTLSWTHSVEKTRWEEDWRVESGRLALVEARVEGFGAGMEPGEGARFDGHVWRWRPKIPPLRELRLARSSAKPEGWTLCANGQCRAVADAAESADVVVLSSCD